MYIAALILLLLSVSYSMLIGSSSIGYILNFIDLPTLLIILSISIPMLLASGLFPDLRRAFHTIMFKKSVFSKKQLQCSLEAVRLTIKLILYSGIFGALICGIQILTRLNDPLLLGPSLAVAMISIIYAVFGCFIFMPIEARLKTLILSAPEE